MEPKTPNLKKPTIPFFAKDLAGSEKTGVTISVSRIGEFDDVPLNREEELAAFENLGIKIMNEEEPRDEPFEVFQRSREMSHHSA